MPIGKNTILAMAKKLRMDTSKVEAAISNDADTEVDIPENVKVLTDSELQSRDGSIKATNIEAGKEILIKELKEAAGLEYDGEGSKDGKRFINELKKATLAESNKTESEKIKEKDSLISQLQEKINAAISEKAAFEKTAKDAATDADILSWTIDLKPEYLSNKEYLNRIKDAGELVEENGQKYFKVDGKIVSTNTDLKPIPAKDAIRDFIKGQGWQPQQQTTEQTTGRGAGDSKGNTLGIANMTQFNKHLKDNNINPTGEKAAALLNEISASNPQFDFAVSQS